MKDVIDITMRSNEAVSWTAEITDASGKEIISSPSETTTLIRWDGRDAAGKKFLTGHTRFPDIRRPRRKCDNGQAVGLIVDTVPVWAALKVPYGFTPNNDGHDDILKITIDASSYENIAARELLLLDKTVRISGSIPGKHNAQRTHMGWHGGE